MVIHEPDLCDKCGLPVTVVWDEPMGQLVACLKEHFDTRPRPQCKRKLDHPHRIYLHEER